MSTPALACGLARVHLYNRDGTTSRGVLSGAGLTATWSKSVDGSAVAFNANMAEAAMVSNPAMCEDALCVVELDVGGTWTPWGTPFVLAPGVGTVIGTSEGAAWELSPVGVGAAVGLCGEWLVLHSGGVVNRRGPHDRYLGWQSASFVDTAWTDLFVVAPSSLSISAAKYKQPNTWPAVAAAADWVYSSLELNLIRVGSFTVSTQRKYVIGFTCDEEAKVYLDGPGWGGIIMETSDQETGYVTETRWAEVLAPGTYFVSFEMTTINSAGGDGFDAGRLYVATCTNRGAAATVVLMTTSAAKGYSQLKTAVRPGFTPAQVVEKLRAENSTWGIPSAALLSVAAGGTAPAGEERVWPVGTSVAQVLTDFDADVSWDVTLSYVLTAWAARGTDRHTTVALTPGAATPTSAMNIEGYGYTSDPVTGTRAVVLTNDGFVQVISTTAESAVAARGMYLESAASGSVAKGTAYALDAIAQSGRVRRAYHGDVIAVTGSIPGVSFGPCDLVTAPNYRKTATTMQVLSITLTNQATYAGFTVEVGEV